MNPEGIPVRLPDRKVEGLLALLALHRDYGIDRMGAAEILWPGRSPTHLATLRQALSVLRRTLGDDAIEASRQHCRLTAALPLATDYDRRLERQGAFMPGHIGDWFEEVRLECETEPIPDAGEIVASFHQTLLWFAAHDRRGLHALLRARPSLTRGIPYGELLQLLNVRREDEECIGWSMYWQGTAEDDLEVCARLLRASLLEAKRTGNLALASEACLELGKVHSRTGRLKQAHRVCEIADAVAAESKAPSAAANAMRLRGTMQVHWQDSRSGLCLLRRMEDLLDDPLEIAMAQSVRAFFEASASDFESASQTLNHSLAISRSMNHYRIGITATMTNVLLRAAAGSKDKAIAELEPLTKHYYAIGSTQFGVYGEELLAAFLSGLGEREASHAHLQSAHQARLKSQMVMTNLEAQRIGKPA